MTEPTPDQIAAAIIDKFEKRVDAQEQLVSNLILGFVELSVAIEGLTKQVLEPLSEAERKEFAADVLGMRGEMMKYLNTVAERMAPDDFEFGGTVDSTFTKSMERMAEGD